MSFSGSVSRESHEGGLLVSFEGRAPGLYTGIRIVGGKFLGRVDSVIGPVNDAYIHIKPLAEDLILKNTIGSPVEIAPREIEDLGMIEIEIEGKKQIGIVI